MDIKQTPVPRFSNPVASPPIAAGAIGGDDARSGAAATGSRTPGGIDGKRRRMSDEISASTRHARRPIKAVAGAVPARLRDRWTWRGRNIAALSIDDGPVNAAGPEFWLPRLGRLAAGRNRGRAAKYWEQDTTGAGRARLHAGGKCPPRNPTEPVPCLAATTKRRPIPAGAGKRLPHEAGVERRRRWDGSAPVGMTQSALCAIPAIARAPGARSRIRRQIPWSAQMVLRGGPAAADAAGHARPYRNFFSPRLRAGSFQRGSLGDIYEHQHRRLSPLRPRTPPGKKQFPARPC